MTTKVWLHGDKMDLDALAQLFADGPTNVRREDDEFYLTSPEINDPPHGDDTYIVAGRLLRLLNGLAAIRYAEFEPVALGGKVTHDSSTTIHPAAATLVIRPRFTATAVVIGPDGTPVVDTPSPWPQRVALAAAHPDLAEVLAIMGGAKALTWANLYDVYEIIRKSIKQSRDLELHELVGVGRKAVGYFSRSAQAGRHARPSGVPENPMTLADGREFVNNLVGVWMETLSTGAGD